MPRFVRNLFTGEISEAEFEGSGIIYREPTPLGTPRWISQAKWPIHSEAMAVNQEDIGKARKILKQHGVKTEYDSLGRPILTSAAHRKAHCAALGFYDRNAGYGDPAPQQFVYETALEKQRLAMAEGIASLITSVEG